MHSVKEMVSCPKSDRQGLLAMLNVSTWLTAMDLGKSYYQLALSTDCQEKNGVCSKTNQYCYRSDCHVTSHILTTYAFLGRGAIIQKCYGKPRQYPNLFRKERR